MNTNVSRYIDLYNELDELLWKIIWVTDNFMQFKEKLYELRDKKYYISWFIRSYFDELVKFWYIRNELVHKYKNYIDVTQSTIDNLEKFILIIRNPQTCFDIFKVDVYCCDFHSALVNEIKEMKRNLFTHIPVFDWNEFKWVLSESCITYFIWEQTEQDWTLLLDNIKISDINLENWNDLYEFIDRKKTIYEIEDMFSEMIYENKRLGVIFITNLWKKWEKIDGIITAWDLPKIKQLYFN